MARRDQVLAFLKERGSGGVSSEEIASKLGLELAGSACKIINRLRKEGYEITHNQKIYTLISQPSKASPGTPPLNQIADIAVPPQTEAKADQKPDMLADTIKTKSKKNKVLEYLLAQGTEGASASDITKHSGVAEQSICFQIHVLRKGGNKIIHQDGKYFLKKVQDSIYGKALRANVTSAANDPQAKLATALNDPKLLSGINKINPEDRTSYLDLLKKIIYYRRCALNMLETTEMLNNITIGVGQ
jgi:biotin operon repressor